MEQFILQSENVILDDNKVNVILKPINTAIIDYIDTCKVYNNLSDATADLSNFITEMTPILYNNMDSSIKANYYL
jgi:hypothetical protein